MGYECIVLLCSDSGQRLEPVGIMGGTVLDGPILHCLCYNISGGQRQLSSVINDLLHFFVYALG